MLFDANASLGQWPFRAHPTHTAEELLARYDAIGVQRALVGSLNAVCYRDCQAGNDELLAAVAPHRERLVPVAVLNPTYAGWEADLDTCCAQGCRGVRLYPNYHRYDLTGPDARRLIEAAMERDLVLCFVCRHEDRRQRNGHARQHVPGPAAKQALAHTAAEGHAKALILGLLRQDDHDQQERGKDFDDQEKADENGHVVWLLNDLKGPSFRPRRAQCQ